MKKIKNFIAGILYRLVLLTAKITPAKKGDNHLLIIKTDEIGDYILFRNSLKCFKESEKYRNYKITLLGTAGWRSLFEHFDSDTVDGAIWIDKTKFKKSLLYRLQLLLEVRNGGYSSVVNCVYSSSILLEDGFAWIVPCKEKVAMLGDNSNIGKYGLNTQPYLYSQIIDSGNRQIFDSFRNRNFLISLLNLGTVPIGTSILSQWTGAKSTYFSLFIGAGNPERRWPIEYFVRCAKYVHEKFGLTPALFGGPTDIENGNRFVELYQRDVKNFVSKTTLPEFLEMLNGSRFTLSVDTGPLHMAVAAGSPVVGLFSGRYYKRYAPYPKEITEQFYAVYPDFIDEVIANGDPSIYDPFVTLNSTIHLIQPEKVIEKIDLVMAV